MSSSFRYTFTKLRSLPSSVNRFFLTFGYCAVSAASASPTVLPDTSTESFSSVNWRSAVGIRILAISIPHYLHASDWYPVGNYARDRIYRSVLRERRTNTTGTSSAGQFARSRHRNPGANGKFQSDPDRGLEPSCRRSEDPPAEARNAHP